MGNRHRGPGPRSDTPGSGGREDRSYAAAASQASWTTRISAGSARRAERAIFRGGEDLIRPLPDYWPRACWRPRDRDVHTGIAGAPHRDLPRMLQTHLGNQAAAACLPAEVNPVPAADRG